MKRTCKRKAEGFLQESGLGSLQAPAGGLRPRIEKAAAGWCERGKEMAGMTMNREADRLKTWRRVACPTPKSRKPPPGIDGTPVRYLGWHGENIGPVVQ